MTKQCPTCGDEYVHIGKHWRHCGYPEIPRQEMLVGLLMGDGSIPAVANGNEFFELQMVTKPFLEHVRDQLGVFANDITQQRSADESAAVGESMGWSSEGDYQAYYCLKLVRHPEFGSMRDRWYPGGQKEYPEDLELTPEIARMWYVCDGGLNWTVHGDDAYGPRVKFACANESGRQQRTKALFEAQGFDPYVDDYAVTLDYEESVRVLDWMGEAPPGFEYKWETDSIHRYKEIQNGI